MSIVFAIVAIILAAISYGLYIRDILSGRTRPHAFTWGIWAILAALIFAQQYSHGAGPGAWPTAFVSIAGTIICVLAWRRGVHKIRALDWLCLAAAGLVGYFWITSQDPDLSVILASIVFLIGFVPTIRKTLAGKPQETTLTYALNSLKFFVALLALQNFTVTTAFYPLVLCVANAVFVIFLLTLHTTHAGKKRRKI
jgi:hypothetical protein